VQFAASRPRILDFGCGCGRIARFFPREFPDAQITGIDVDADATAWCADHLKGRYETAGLLPPTRLPSSSFDLVIAVSMFTHFDEPAQDAWLEELARVLRSDGLLIATTHSPLLTFERPDLTLEQHQTLARTGFLFAGSPGRFNEQSAFHAPEYLRTHWLSWFELVDYTAHGLAGYQDLSVFRRLEKTSAVGRKPPFSEA
jgi:SAM-dependent methyltransferase